MDKAVADYIAQTGQARPRGENKWYSPGRDISALLPILVRSALMAWEDPDNTYRKINDRTQFTETDVCKVAESLAAFMSEECIVNTTSFEDAFRKAGFEDIPVAARIIVFGMITEEVLCAFWYAIRTATSGAEGEIEIVQYSPEVLAMQAKRFARLFRVPRWRRTITTYWWDLKAWLRSKLDGNGSSEELPGN